MVREVVGPRRRPRAGAGRRRPRHSRRLPAGEGVGRSRGHGADGAPAARSLRLAARHRRLSQGDCRCLGRAADDALSAQRRDRHRRPSPTLCAVPGVKGVKWATPNPLKLAEAQAACDPSHRLGRRSGRDLGAGLLCRRRARLHLGPDQCLAGALAGDPCRAGGGRLCQGQCPDRRHAGLRGHPRRGDERHQRHRRQGRAARAGPRLRPDRAPPRPGR